MGRGDSSGSVLALGPAVAFESLNNWCYLYVKLYLLVISKKKKDNALRSMREFLVFSEILPK